jgi:uncharacterized protein DUF1570
MDRNQPTPDSPRPRHRLAVVRGRCVYGSRLAARSVLILLTLWALLATSMSHRGFGAENETGELFDRLQQVERQHADALEELAAAARAADLTTEANLAAGWLPPKPIIGQRLFVASNLYWPDKRSSSGSETRETDWWQRFESLRQGQGDKYYQLAEQAARLGEVGLALRLATNALRESPDHPEARRLAGYQRVGAQWGGGYAVRMAAMGRTWHSPYGWIRAREIERWDAGERPSGRAWISSEQDARQHATLEQGWHVRSDHYEIVTNASRASATLLASRLETLYQIWLQLFGGYALTSKEVVRRIDGKPVADYRSHPFQVRYHRSREQYIGQLRRVQPMIGITLGIYFDTTSESHFFAGPDQDAGTIHHEAVHQLFQESSRSVRNVAAEANAWVLEGVACYFESLVYHSRQDSEEAPVENPSKSSMANGWSGTLGYATIGTPATGRLAAARHRRLVDQFYLPLREFSALGAQGLQRHDEIAKLYSQAAGLATFMMEDQQGRYRKALAAYMQAVYTGRDSPNTLEKVTGQSFEQLDQQYFDFLKRLP